MKMQQLTGTIFFLIELIKIKEKHTGNKSNLSA